MTAAKTDETRPMVHDLKASQCQQLARAAELYCRHLGSLEEKASTLRRSAEAAKYHREVEGLREELVGKLSSGHPGDALIYPRHRPILAKGIEFLITNLRAAKGTLKPLGKDEWIQALEIEADQVEQELLSLFVDQLEMDVAADKAKKGEGLKLLADEEVKKTELEVETQGMYRMGDVSKRGGGQPKKSTRKGKK